MQQADFEHFRVRMVTIARMHSAQLDGPMLDLYWLCLRDWTLPEFERAVAHLLNNAERMPKPSHFTDLRRKAAGEAAAEAWTRVVHIAAMPDHRRDVELRLNPLSERALRVVEAMGGWHHLGMAETATRHFREKHFREVWDELGDIDEARAVLPALAHRSTRPVPIGPARANFAAIRRTENATN